MYFSGKDVEADYQQAFIWYTKAAEDDGVHSDYAQNKLGDMYFTGKGVERDYKQAFDWYSKAANAGDQGNELAQLSLGHMYKEGIGVEKKDMKKAKYWYDKAAAERH